MDIIKYHNDVNLIKLGTLTENELNIFIGILFKMQEKGNNKIIMDFSDLNNLIESSNRSSKRLSDNILSMSSKLIKLNQKLEIGDKTLFLNLFQHLEINKTKKTLEIQITEKFQYYLNSITKNFTYYSLKEYVNLGSKYSKQVYKFLKQYRANGWFEIPLDKFKEVLLVPEGYKMIHLTDKILKPLQKELLPMFKNLVITKLTKDRKIVGRGKKTYYLKFTWDHEVKENKSLLQNVKKKQDKAIIDANKKAKMRIDKQQKERELKNREKNNIKELSPIDNLKGEIAKELIKSKKISLFESLSTLDSMRSLHEFIKKNNIKFKIKEF